MSFHAVKGTGPDQYREPDGGRCGTPQKKTPYAAEKYGMQRMKKQIKDAKELLMATKSYDGRRSPPLSSEDQYGQWYQSGGDGTDGIVHDDGVSRTEMITGMVTDMI